MGKKVKKWYVVTVGKDVGVFESWLEASSLISGVPGALHESFNSEEEARRIFHRQRDNGNTKIVGGPSSQTNAPRVTPPSPVRAESRSVSSGSSSPRLLETPQSRRSPQPATPAARLSPLVLHANVTYTRGPSSSPSVSITASRRAFPRVALRKPSDIVPYPSDSEDAPSTPRSSFQDEGKLEIKELRPRSGPHHSSPASISSNTGLPVSTGQSSPRALIGNPLNVESYQSTGGSSNEEKLLSPLNSPKFYTAPEMPPSPSTKSLFAHHSRMAYSSDHLQYRYTCRNCQHTSTDIPIVSLSISQNIQAPRRTPTPMLKDDPRSPMMTTDSISGHFSESGRAVAAYLYQSA